MNKKVKFGIILGIGLLLIAGLFIAYRILFGAPQKQGGSEIFTVGMKQDESQILDKLKSQGFIRNKLAFNLVLSLTRQHGKITPGGYNLSKNLSVWQLENKITAAPDMKWVVIPEAGEKNK